MQIPSCGFHCVQVPLCGFHRADSTVRISSCRFYCAGSFMPIRSFPSSAFHRFHRAHSIQCIPSKTFYRANANFILRVVSCGFHRADHIMCLPSSAFHCVHSIVCIPLCAFHRVHSITCIASCDRRRKEEVNEDRGGYMGASYSHLYLHRRRHQRGCINSECIG